MANRYRRRVESSARLSTLLDELETALPVLAGTAMLAKTDWSDIDRRLNRVRLILAGGTRGRRSRRVRPTGARPSGGADGPIVSLFG